MPRKKKKSITYEIAPDIQRRCLDIVQTLKFEHIDLAKVVCLRSRGSSARQVIARCHGMSKVLQIAMRVKAFYVLEFLAERFDKLDEGEQDETIIHELMHIPKNFGGGFRHHHQVTDKKVQQMHARYRKEKEKQSRTPEQPSLFEDWE